MGEGAPVYFLKSAKLEAERIDRVRLKENSLPLRGGVIPITFSELVYRCDLVMVRNGEIEERSNRFYCHEIRSVSAKEKAYSWAVWSLSPLGKFSLVKGEKENTYLVWGGVRPELFFAEISEPRDRLVAISDLLSGRPTDVVSVPLSGLITRKEFGLYSATIDVEARGLKKEASGKITLELFIPPTKMTVTLQYDGKKWRRL